MEKINGQKWLYKILRTFFEPLFKWMYHPVMVRREAIPFTGGAVIAGNHKHALDPILIDTCTKRMVYTLAKKELHDGPFGFLFKGIGSIPVDLHSKRNHEALQTSIYELKKEQLINVSPEAKRNYTEELLLPFKYGAVAMARAAEVPIIPYAIVGDYKFFKGRIKVVFGEPMRVEKEEDLFEANEKLYNSILALLKSETDEEVLKTKKVTSFREWSKQNEA